MTIVFNGEPREIAAGATVGTLLRELNLPAQRVAVEVNLEIVSRDLHDRFSLHEGDRLEIVTLVGGG